MIVRLSRPARQDIEDIREYTVERWGRKQWLTYFGALSAAFERIASDCNVGRDRSLLRSGMRSLLCGRHVIFFAPVPAAGREFVILRIVHGHRTLLALAYYDDPDSV